jgi:hypothetical protein
MVNPNRFYTYAYLREDGTPYYIGKGSYRRAYKRNGKPCGVPKDKSRIIFLKQNLTEEKAFAHEKYMIAMFGRKDLGTGILHNRTDGGDGVSGLIVSDEIKRKLSICNTGKKLSQKTREKMSQSQKNMSKETRLKIGLSRKGKTHTGETKKKISETKKGRKNSVEHIEKIRLSSKIRKVNCKFWKIAFADGNVIYKDGIFQWANENGYNPSHIGKVASGKLKKHKDIVAVEKLEHPPTTQEHFSV